MLKTVKINVVELLFLKFHGTIKYKIKAEE